MAITIVIVVVTFFAMIAFTKYLVSTIFEERNATSIRQRMLQMIPWNAIKGVIVVWQILTQASDYGVPSLPVREVAKPLCTLRTCA